jgi:hypothetical protein
MSDSIINFLKKQGDIFSSAKYFGGIDKLREIGKTNPEIMDMITKSSYGYMEFQAGDRPGQTKTYRFDFYVLDYDMEDDMGGGDYNHAYLAIDLIVDYPNLTDEEQFIIKIIREKKEISLDVLSIKSEMNSGNLSGLLLKLELEGIVQQMPGMRYKI